MIPFIRPPSSAARRRALSLLAGGAAAMTGLPAAASAAPGTLMVFGDSLSAEYGLAQGSGWVALLDRRLRAERPGWRVVNASISGETTLGGRNRLEAELSTHRPQVLFIALGGNDGLRGVSLESTRANLEAMIGAARKSGARPVMAGMRLPQNYGRTYGEKFRVVFVEVAKRQQVPLVPFLLEPIAERRDLFQADGIHPTAAAQPMILDTVWPVLSPLLR